jgi:hypothetical protein
MRAASRLALLIAAWPYTGPAQELEPRFYSNAPVGVNVLVAGYAYSEGSVLVDPSLALDNADLAIDGPYLGYARSMSIGGRTGKFDAGIANACIEGSAEFEGEPVSRKVCGWSDAKLRFSLNFLGSPALSPREFAAYEQDLVVGATLLLSAPIGRYDPERLVNIGTNRWAARTELGMSKGLERWLLEASVSASFYETNSDFFGGRRRKQDPIYAFQAHVVRRLNRGVWVALDYIRYRGGQTETDGLADANLQSNARVGFTLSVPVARRHTLRLSASSGLLTRTGTDFDTIGLSWAYIWGRDL